MAYAFHIYILLLYQYFLIFKVPWFLKYMKGNKFNIIDRWKQLNLLLQGGGNTLSFRCDELTECILTGA